VNEISDSIKLLLLFSLRKVTKVALTITATTHQLFRS